MLGDELARALQNGARLTENECDREEVAGAQQVGDEVFDDRDQLGPDGAVGLQLEQIEQHRQDVAAQVLRVLPLDVLLEVRDLAVFQEVERGVEVVDRHQAVALGRRLVLHGAAQVGRRRRRDGLARLDRRRVLAGELPERVADELKVLRPEQRQQVVGGIGLEVARPLQHAQEAHDLRFLDARLERERADAVLVERPGDALTALLLVVDEVVRQVELGGPDPLRQDLQQLFDLLRRQRQLGYGRVGQVAAPVSSATMATSLSPRPLRFSNTTSPARHAPRGASTQATAWALSNAGRIPSRRESETNASSACRSVTASYNTRPLSFKK